MLEEKHKKLSRKSLERKLQIFMKTAKIKPWAQNVLKIVKMGSEPTFTSFLVNFTIQTKNNSKIIFDIKDDFPKNPKKF